MKTSSTSAGPTARNSTSDDPLGKRALFSPPTSETSDMEEVDTSAPDGVRALYSTSTKPQVEPTPRHNCSMVLDCSRCGEKTGLALLDVARLTFLSLWVPYKSYDRWLSCPECKRRTWCRVIWER